MSTPSTTEDPKTEYTPPAPPLVAAAVGGGADDTPLSTQRWGKDWNSPDDGLGSKILPEQPVAKVIERAALASLDRVEVMAEYHAGAHNGGHVPEVYRRVADLLLAEAEKLSPVGALRVSAKVRSDAEQKYFAHLSSLSPVDLLKEWRATEEASHFEPEGHKPEYVQLLLSALETATALTARLTTEAADAQEAKDAYEEWGADVRRLTRELDVALFGKDAAEQASLCDLVRPAAKLVNDLRAKLAHEGEQEAQLLKRDEELRGLTMQLHDAWTEARDLEYEAAAARYVDGPRLEKANAEIAEHYRLKRAGLPTATNDSAAAPLHRGTEGKEVGRDWSEVTNVFFSLTLINRFRAMLKLGLLTKEEFDASANRDALIGRALASAKEQGLTGKLCELLNIPTHATK